MDPPPQGSSIPFRRIVLGATAVALALTVGITLRVVPLRFAYRSGALHVALETAACLISLLVGYLLLSRFRRTHARNDLAIGLSLFLSGAVDLFFSLVPSIASANSPFSTWAPLCGRIVATGALALAAFQSSRAVREPRRAVRRGIVAVLAVLIGVAAIVAAAGSSLPTAIDPAISPTESTHALVVGNGVVLALQLVLMGLFALAAAGFLRGYDATREELLGWFALGTVLAAAARLNYFLFPSVYSSWVYSGDGLRLAYHLALLTGVLREIAAYQLRLARGAVLEERRRLARDIHDGLAQELAFIATQARILTDGSPHRAAENVAAAAERALDEARSAIDALTPGPGETLHMAIARAAEDVAARSGVQVQLDLADEVHATDAIREMFVRIVREAVTNAARHGEAQLVTISLANEHGLRLTVIDDGRGWDPDAPGTRVGGFGITSMRERIEAQGGSFSLQSRPGAGTRVDVVLP